MTTTKHMRKKPPPIFDKKSFGNTFQDMVYLAKSLFYNLYIKKKGVSGDER